jgi:hypothetical protein
MSENDYLAEHGEGYVALIDGDRPDYYHRLERERIHLPCWTTGSAGLAKNQGITICNPVTCQAAKERLTMTHDATQSL